MLRSEYNHEIETLKLKYLFAQETIEQLRKELKLKEEILHLKQQNSGGIFNICVLPLNPLSDRSYSFRLKPLAQERDLIMTSLKSPLEKLQSSPTGTNPCAQSNQLCQTDSPTSSDFQSHVAIPSDKVSMTTQTNGFVMKDFQVQVNVERANAQIEHQTIQAIKTENVISTIPMPNVPNSISQTPSKKRKRSSSILVETPIQTQNVSMDADPSILNSVVYKTYCRNENPKEAMKEIKNMKTCLSFTEPTMPLPKKEVLKKSCEKSLEKLWAHENPSISKWEKIQAFLEREITEYDISNDLIPVKINGKIEKQNFWFIVQNSFTRIKIILPNGIEFWYVENFEGGAGVSKWYRGVTTETSDDFFGEYAECLALLRLYGLEESVIEKYHYDFLKKKPEEIAWMDFAYTFVGEETERFLPDTFKSEVSRVDYDFKESKTCDTIVMEVTLRFNIYNRTKRTKSTVKSYYGKSTRSLKKKKIQQNDKDEMMIEAQKAALIECFKDRFGFTEFKDISIDELHRPLTA